LLNPVAPSWHWSWKKKATVGSKTIRRRHK
jgi:hypothetical protein